MMSSYQSNNNYWYNVKSPFVDWNRFDRWRRRRDRSISFSLLRRLSFRTHCLHFSYRRVRYLDHRRCDYVKRKKKIALCSSALILSPSVQRNIIRNTYDDIKRFHWRFWERRALQYFLNLGLSKNVNDEDEWYEYALHISIFTSVGIRWFCSTQYDVIPNPMRE